MGRRKIEMKPIENKSRRLVTFSKRRAGLIKKAKQLSVLCDVDVAVVVFSTGGKVYEFCSDSTSSVEHILSGCQKICPETEERTTKGADEDLCTQFRSCKELLQMVDRFVEENTTKELSVTDMVRLEEELNAALVQTRSKKTQLMMKYISTLQEEERKLSEEKEQQEKHIASAKKIISVDDEGGGLNNVANYHINSPLPVTLPLFIG